MSDDDGTGTGPTRRAYVRYGGAVVGGGLLAGCTGQGTSETSDGGASSTESSTDDEGYTVEMFPVGEVTFDAVPETWTSTSNDGWADMAIALGQADGCRTRGARTRLYYDALGIDVDTDWPWLWQDGGYAKETFYERDADLHLIDPNLVLHWDDNWDQSDIEEVESTVGPFFSCYNRRTTTDWQKELGYPDEAPSMLEAFEKLGEVFRESDRAEAFLDVHDEMQAELDARMEGLDPATIGLVNGGSDPEQGTFYPLDLSEPGYEMKTYRDLRVDDAFADLHDGEYGGELDYEGLLDVDPEVIVVHWGIVNTDDGQFDPEAFHENYVAPMEDHPVGEQLTAVKRGNVYPGPYPEQGPITNLFQTELTGQLLYPERFGEFDPEQYPDVPEEYRLFDRDHVRAIVAGDV